MTKSEFEKHGTGLFKVFWKTGGSSLASIGVHSDGTRWIASTNWIFPAKVNYKIYNCIYKIKRIA